MNKKLLKPGIQEYIEKYKNTDIVSVALKSSPFEGILSSELAQQIDGLQRSRKKLPVWYKTTGLYFPKKVHLEQSSSEETAAFKAGLISGNRLADLTGGMGVDTLAFSRKFEEVDYFEKNKELSEITAHNFKVFKQRNIRIFHKDGIKALQNSADRYDWIYLDPSRRDTTDKKVFRIEEYDPKLTEVLPVLWRHTSALLIKTSPLLDIQSGINALEHVHTIYVVAVSNEVKELLWVLKQDRSETVMIEAVNLTENSENRFRFSLTEEATSPVNYSPIKKYLYEPHAALMKAAGFKSVASRYHLYKLHPNTHLFTSDRIIDFPGRRFRVEHIFPYKAKKLRFPKANITTRNFPESVSQIRKKTKITDGGTDYLFFITDNNEQLSVLHTTKILS